MVLAIQSYNNCIDWNELFKLRVINSLALNIRRKLYSGLNRLKRLKSKQG